METAVFLVLVPAMIALAALVIHFLNQRRSDRVAAFPYGRSRRSLGSPRDRRLLGDRWDSPDTTAHQSPAHFPVSHTPAPGHHARRDHRDGGRGHLRRPRRR